MFVLWRILWQKMEAKEWLKQRRNNGGLWQKIHGQLMSVIFDFLSKLYG